MTQGRVFRTKGSDVKRKGCDFLRKRRPSPSFDQVARQQSLTDQDDICFPLAVKVSACESDQSADHDDTTGGLEYPLCSENALYVRPRVRLIHRLVPDVGKLLSGNNLRQSTQNPDEPELCCFRCGAVCRKILVPQILLDGLPLWFLKCPAVDNDLGEVALERICGVSAGIS